MQPKQPMNKAQQRILVLSLLLIILIAALTLLFSGEKQPRAPVPTDPPEATFSTIQDALTNLPTPTPNPTTPPTATPAAPGTPVPAATQAIVSLKKGSKGVDVVKLQVRLIELGYLQAGQNDGDYGSGTEAAVKEFQRVNGIKEDGIAGSQTQTLLYSQDAKPKK